MAVGRAEEMAALQAALDETALGDGSIAWLEGEAGIGKSVLWDFAVDAARAAGFEILAARPAEPEAELGFAGLTELLGGVDDEVLATLPGAQRTALLAALLRDDGSPCTVTFREAVPLAQAGLAAARGSGDPAFVTATEQSAAYVDFLTGQGVDVPAARHRAKTEARMTLSCTASWFLATMLLTLDETDEARPILTWLAEKALDDGDVPTTRDLQRQLVELELRASRLEEAEGWAMAVDELVVADADHTTIMHPMLAMIEARRGANRRRPPPRARRPRARALRRPPLGGGVGGVGRRCRRARRACCGRAPDLCAAAHCGARARRTQRDSDARGPARRVARRRPGRHGRRHRRWVGPRGRSIGPSAVECRRCSMPGQRSRRARLRDGSHGVTRS